VWLRVVIGGFLDSVGFTTANLTKESNRDRQDDELSRAPGEEPRCRSVGPDGRLRHFPNKAAITCLVAALLLEQNDEWAVQRARYTSLKSSRPISDDPLVSLPAVANRQSHRRQ